jgi:hypothetical protein
MASLRRAARRALGDPRETVKASSHPGPACGLAAVPPAKIRRYYRKGGVCWGESIDLYHIPKRTKVGIKGVSEEGA